MNNIESRLYHHVYEPGVFRQAKDIDNEPGINNSENTGRLESRLYAILQNRIGQKKLHIYTDRGAENDLTKTQQQIVRCEIHQIASESLSGVKDAKDIERIAAMAPELLSAVIESPYINGVENGHLLDAARWAVECARDPKLITQTTIRTGFGGSDDYENSMRYPAYLLPALDIWERIKKVRNTRLDRAYKIASNRIYHELVNTLGHEPDKDEKKILREKANTEANSLDINMNGTPDIMEEAGYFEMPAINFFYAPNAAIDLNGKEAEKVKTNASKGQKLAQEFIRRFYPDAYNYIKITTDHPAKVYGPLNNLALNYLMDLVSHTEDPIAKEALEQLKNLGFNHGMEQGRERAARYAALHAPIFQDRVKLPIFDSIITQDNESKFSITLGGRPERLFNKLRIFLSNNANPEDFLEYTESAHKKGEITDHHLRMVQKWTEFYRQRRSGYAAASMPAWSDADLPLLTIPFITEIGKQPVYYQTDYDLPINAASVAEAREKGITTLLVEKSVKTHTDNEPSPEKRNKYKDVTGDYNILIKAVGEDELLNFYTEYVRRDTATEKLPTEADIYQS